MSSILPPLPSLFAMDAVANVTATDFPTLATLPASNSEYATAAYWDGRFQSELDYEWFKGCAEARAVDCASPEWLPQLRSFPGTS